MKLEHELLLAGVYGPIDFSQAMKENPWERAMQQEIKVIERNNTWRLVDLPPGHKSIGMKWMFKLKGMLMGEVIKHNARLFAKGYVQKHGIDFEEVFGPVTRLDR